MIAQQIRQLRLSKGITQKELAEAIHVTPSAISQYENGKAQPSRENMMLLADYFNVSVPYIEGISQIEIFESKMNEEYVTGLVVQKFIEKCLCVSQPDRMHLLRIVELLANANSNRR